MNEERGLSRDYFEQLYARRPDPWGFDTRWYERRKRALTMAALPRPAYGRVLELGSSTGLLTALLAERSEALVAVEISEAAAEEARRRLAGARGVTVERADVRDGLPAGRFDLIVVSEVAYYLSQEDVRALADDMLAHLHKDGEVVLCHWRWPVADYPLSGDAVHELLADALGLERLSRLLEPDLVLEVFSADPRSVATREGLR